MSAMYCDESPKKTTKSTKKNDSDSDESSKKKQQKEIKKYESDSDEE